MKKTELKALLKIITEEVMQANKTSLSASNVKGVIQRDPNSPYTGTPDGGEHDVCVLLAGGRALFGYMKNDINGGWDYNTFKKLEDNTNHGHQYFGPTEVSKVETIGQNQVKVHIKNDENVDLFIVGSTSNPNDVKNDQASLNFQVIQTGWTGNLNENYMKKSELKQLISEIVQESMWARHHPEGGKNIAGPSANDWRDPQEADELKKSLISAVDAGNFDIARDKLEQLATLHT